MSWKRSQTGQIGVVWTRQEEGQESVLEDVVTEDVAEDDAE